MLNIIMKETNKKKKKTKQKSLFLCYKFNLNNENFILFFWVRYLKKKRVRKIEKKETIDE